MNFSDRFLSFFDNKIVYKNQLLCNQVPAHTINELPSVDKQQNSKSLASSRIAFITSKWIR